MNPLFKSLFLSTFLRLDLEFSSTVISLFELDMDNFQFMPPSLNLGKPTGQEKLIGAGGLPLLQ